MKTYERRDRRDKIRSYGGEDFFSKRLGYVLEGKRRGTLTKAMEFLMDECCMEREEAENYCRRLCNEAFQNAAQGVM